MQAFLPFLLGPCVPGTKFLMNIGMNTWTPQSWRDKNAKQLPAYADQQALQKVEGILSGLPPLVFAGEARSLKKSAG